MVLTRSRRPLLTSLDYTGSVTGAVGRADTELRRVQDRANVAAAVPAQPFLVPPPGALPGGGGTLQGFLAALGAGPAGIAPFIAAPGPPAAGAPAPNFIPHNVMNLILNGSESLQDFCIFNILAREYQICTGPLGTGPRRIDTYTRTANGPGTYVCRTTPHVHAADHIDVPVASLTPALVTWNHGVRTYTLEWHAMYGTVAMEKRTYRKKTRPQDIPFRGNVVLPFRDNLSALDHTRNGTLGVFPAGAPGGINDETCAQFCNHAFGSDANAAHPGLVRHLILGPEVAYWFGGPEKMGWQYREPVSFKALTHLRTLGLDFTHERWEHASLKTSSKHILSIIENIRLALVTAGNHPQAANNGHVLQKIVVVGLQGLYNKGNGLDGFPQGNAPWVFSDIETDEKRPDSKDLNWFRILGELVVPNGGQVILGDRGAFFVLNPPSLWRPLGAPIEESHWGTSANHFNFPAGSKLHYANGCGNPISNTWPQSDQWPTYTKNQW